MREAGKISIASCAADRTSDTTPKRTDDRREPHRISLANIERATGDGDPGSSSDVLTSSRSGKVALLGASCCGAGTPRRTSG